MALPHFAGIERVPKESPENDSLLKPVDKPIDANGEGVYVRAFTQSEGESLNFVIYT